MTSSHTHHPIVYLAAHGPREQQPGSPDSGDALLPARAASLPCLLGTSQGLLVHELVSCYRGPDTTKQWRVPPPGARPVRRELVVQFPVAAFFLVWSDECRHGFAHGCLQRVWALWLAVLQITRRRERPPPIPKRDSWRDGCRVHLGMTPRRDIAAAVLVFASRSKVSGAGISVPASQASPSNRWPALHEPGFDTPSRVRDDVRPRHDSRPISCNT